MHRELPLYIFIRNTVILCLLFFAISFVIIERGKIERGENSIFNGIIINKNNIRDYNSPDVTSTDKKDQDFHYSNFTSADSLDIMKKSIATLVQYTIVEKKSLQEIDL